MLNNMKIWMGNFLFNTNGISMSSSSGGSALFLPTINGDTKPLISIDGVPIKIFNTYFSISRHMFALGKIATTDSSAGVTLQFGADKNNTTIEDTYSLSIPFDKNVLLSNVSSVINYADDCNIRLIVNGTITNNTGSAIEIGEVGFMLNFASYTDNKAQYQKILLDRKSYADNNFDVIKLGAGESKVFAYAIEL